jgi:hypothetical protein
MLECRVELQKLAGVALRTFLPHDIGRNANRYGRMMRSPRSSHPNSKFRTCGNNMFITRPHFGLCLSLLTAYHYHIRRPSPPSLSEICNAGSNDATYVRAQLLFSGSLPLVIFRAHLMGFSEQPNSRLSRGKHIALPGAYQHTGAHARDSSEYVIQEETSVSFMSVSYEGTQTRTRRDVHLSDKLSPTVDFTRRIHAFSTTRNRPAQDVLPDSSRLDDRVGREG